MALANYTLTAPSTVILADARDPWVSWQNHLDRTGGLRGGVDIVAAVGTPIYARTSGWLFHYPNDGTAGNSSRFVHEDNPGWKDVFSHLESYVRPSGAYFSKGEVCAISGDTGGVSPHLHWHLLDPQGTRRNPWDYFTDVTGAASVAGRVPVTEDEQPMEDDMAWSKPPFYRTTNGPIQNSAYLIVIDEDRSLAIEVDGRTVTANNVISSFMNQQAQYFDASGKGIAYQPFVLTTEQYAAVRAKYTLVSAPLSIPLT